MNGINPEPCEERRLLIVEDDERYARSLARVLVRHAFQVEIVGVADLALNLADEFRPSHVLLDLNLGGKSGLNLVVPLLSMDADMRIVVLTGYASIATAVSAIRLGAADYLTKPVMDEELLLAVERDAQMPVRTHEIGAQKRARQITCAERDIGRTQDSGDAATGFQPRNLGVQALPTGQRQHVVVELVVVVPQPRALVELARHRLGDLQEVLEELAGDVLVHMVVLRKLQRENPGFEV